MNALHCLSVPCALLSVFTVPALARQALWIRQDGSAAYDGVQVATQDGIGGVYVGGATQGNFGGASAGEDDAWLARFDASGQRLWLAQFGSSRSEWLSSGAADGTNGVFVGGSTRGSLGAPNADPSETTLDPWLAYYTSAGTRTWISQWGTAASDQLLGVVSDDGGGAFLGGMTFGDLSAANLGGADAWLARCDAAGHLMWSVQFGTSGLDATLAVASDDSGGVFAGGSESGSSSGFERAWLARFSGSGQQLWKFQVPAAGLSQRISAALSDGFGDVYVLGHTDTFPPYAGHGWVARYDSVGALAWTRVVGNHIPSSAFTRDAQQRVYVGGAGGQLARFDSAGQLDWQLDLVGASESIGRAAPSRPGAVFIAGTTYSDLAASNAGDGDAWVARVDPDIAAGFCTSSVTTLGCRPVVRGFGRPSASASSAFVIAVESVEGERLGLCFYGIDNSGFTPRPWSAGSSSFLCVRAPHQRLAIQSSGGTAQLCDGALALDWNAFVSVTPGALGQPFGAGQSVFVQGWFRDAAAPRGSNLSNGLWFELQP
ncbi:MAG: hypothetical protein IT454_15015 [Planctomycetes bacterium]|nr:hypothetical protein [Planctomycetota bacterium]